MALKDRLRELRESRGITQKQCAEDLGVSYDNYNKWENGSSPNFDTLIKIAAFFKTTTDYLLGYSSERYAPQTMSANNLEEKLLIKIKNELTGFLIKYNEYKKTEGSLNLDTLLSFSIEGDFSNMLEKHVTLIDRLSNIQECETMLEIDSIVDKYLNSLGEVHIGGRGNPDGSWTDGISDFEIELWLRDELEKVIPGYRDYRDLKIKEWVKRKKSEID